MPAKIKSSSDYLAKRSTGTHFGLDIAAVPGTPVVAPEPMTVLHFAVNDSTPPLSRFGPAAVLTRGASGVYHVLGHMDAWAWSGAGKSLLPWVGRTYAEGELVGRVSKLRHLHWETRIVELPPGSEARRAYVVSPLGLLSGEVTSVAPVSGRTSVLLILVVLYALTRR